MSRALALVLALALAACGGSSPSTPADCQPYGLEADAGAGCSIALICASSDGQPKDRCFPASGTGNLILKSTDTAWCCPE